MRKLVVTYIYIPCVLLWVLMAGQKKRANRLLILCMNWMVSNVTAKEDANDNVFPRKEQKGNKIDGFVALLMAMYLTKSKPKP